MPGLTRGYRAGASTAAGSRPSPRGRSGCTAALTPCPDPATGESGARARRRTAWRPPDAAGATVRRAARTSAGSARPEPSNGGELPREAGGAREIASRAAAHEHGAPVLQRGANDRDVARPIVASATEVARRWGDYTPALERANPIRAAMELPPDIHRPQSNVVHVLHGRCCIPA